MKRRTPNFTLFPYTTLFRSVCDTIEYWILNSRDLVVKMMSAVDGVVINDDEARLLCKNRSEEHTSELQSHSDLVCRLLLEKKKNTRAESNHLDRKGAGGGHS